MLSLIEFLEEIDRNRQTVVIEPAEVVRLVDRFGPDVRAMGVWNHSTDGSVEIPMGNITEAVKSLEDRTLNEAVRQLKRPEEFAGLLNNTSAAQRLIQALRDIHLRQFQSKAERYQQAENSAEVEALRRELSRELFGS